MLGTRAAPLSRCARALLLLSSPSSLSTMAGLGKTALLSELGSLAQGQVATQRLLAPWRVGGAPSSGPCPGTWAPAVGRTEGEERGGRSQVVQPRAMARSKGGRGGVRGGAAPPPSSRPEAGGGEGGNGGEAEAGAEAMPRILTPGRHLMDDWSRDWVEKEERREAQSKSDRTANHRRAAQGAAGRGQGAAGSRPTAGAGAQWGRSEKEKASFNPNAGSASRSEGSSFRTPPRSSGQQWLDTPSGGALGRGGETRGAPRNQARARAVHTVPSRHAQADPPQLASERDHQTLRGGQGPQGPVSAASGPPPSPHLLYAATPAPSSQPKAGVPPPPPAPAWTERDAATVASALRKAEGAAAPRVTGTPSRAAGSDVLLGRSLEELEQLAVELGQQKYRGRQLHQFIYKNKGTDLDTLEQLPKEVRQVMAERGFRVGRAPVHHIAAAADGTAKVLLLLEDSRVVEAVGIPAEGDARGTHRLTACISSQVGCPLRCSFCATGKGGFSRNLRPHEIVGQVLALEELFGQRVSNVVFMGMGEPMLNMPSVLAAIRCLNRDIGIGQRMITVSTVGVPNTISRLAEHRLQSTLAVSLHAPNQQLREQLVPSAMAYPMHALLNDCAAYFDKTGRRVSIEYTLLAGVNDQREHAAELARTLRRHGLAQHVNVIPYNPVSDAPYRRPSKAYVMAFVDELQRNRIQATVRQTRGMEANAACGQLRNDFQKQPLQGGNADVPLAPHEAAPAL